MKLYPTYERVREVLDYNPETGILTWRARPAVQSWNPRFVGTKSGTRRTGDNYIYLNIDGERYYAHVIIGIWMTGECLERDHKDGDPSNNRWSNLRAATNALNRRNTKRRKDNTSGFKGVRRSRSGHDWQASITVNKKEIYLGQRSTPEAAHELYRKASLKYHGEFGRFE
jgi:hypothetical protein